MLVEFLSGFTVPGRSYAVGEVGYLTGDRLTVALHQGVAKVDAHVQRDGLGSNEEYAR